MLFRRVSDWPSYRVRSPFGELDRMRREMERLFGEIDRGGFTGPTAGVFPLMNLTENPDTYIVRAELPGMKADEIDISVTQDNLSISGERKIPAESADAKYHRKERDAGKFSRIVSLPGPVNTEKVEASSVNGILTVVFPKAEEAKPKQITIKAE